MKKHEAQTSVLDVLLIIPKNAFPFNRYDLLHNAHLNLEGLDELFKVAQV